MSKVSPALRARLLNQRGQRAQNSGGSLLIDNKTIDETGIKLRLLPVTREGASIAEEYLSYYCKELNTGVTSPAVFDLPCPIADASQEIWASGTFEQKEHLRAYINITREFWMPVLVRGEEGTAEHPNIRIFRCKASIFDRIVEWMTDEDMDDMTDPQEGRDIKVKKTGQGIETRWFVDRLDKSPISDDAAFAESVLARGGAFDVRQHFYNFKLETLDAMYDGLTGKELPDHYREHLEGFKPDAGGGDTSFDVEKFAAEVRAVEEADAETTPTEAVEALPEKMCQFEDDDGNIVTGAIVGSDDEDEDNFLVVEKGGDPECPWSIPMTEVTVLEVASEEPVDSKPKARKKKKAGGASSSIRDRARKG
jgi:hypothetical protein